jgi:hypothetical protein
MKKTTSALFVLLSFLFFIACSSDDSADPKDFPGNNLTTGVSAKDLLANDNFSNLEIEVAFVEGFEPEQQTLDNLRSFLMARTFKENISFNPHPVTPSKEAPYTIDDIRDMESGLRESSNSENTIRVFIFFADGDNAGNEGNQVTLGSAYKNTSIVVYEKTIRDFTNTFAAPSRVSVETISLTHEFSHLFGLVDIGSPAQSDHEDPDSNGHCTTENCLMRAEAQFATGIMGMLGNGIPDLQQECIADLQANGGK